MMSLWNLNKNIDLSGSIDSRPSSIDDLSVWSFTISVRVGHGFLVGGGAFCQWSAITLSRSKEKVFGDRRFRLYQPARA